MAFLPLSLQFDPAVTYRVRWGGGRGLLSALLIGSLNDAVYSSSHSVDFFVKNRRGFYRGSSSGV